MMPAISSESKARSVLLRMLPAEPSRSNAATPASSSGKSATQTRSYSPTVHSSSRTLPPELWTSLVNSSARCVVSRKFLMPCSVQLNKDTYVVTLAPPRLRECAPCCSLQQASQRTPGHARTPPTQPLTFVLRQRRRLNQGVELGLVFIRSGAPRIQYRVAIAVRCRTSSARSHDQPLSTTNARQLRGPNQYTVGPPSPGPGSCVAGPGCGGDGRWREVRRGSPR